MINLNKFIFSENVVILIKTITYRIISSFITFLAAWGVTGSASTGGMVMLFRGALGIVWYMIHEKGWYWLIKKFNLP